MKDYKIQTDIKYLRQIHKMIYLKILKMVTLSLLDNLFSLFYLNLKLQNITNQVRGLAFKEIYQSKNYKLISQI